MPVVCILYIFKSPFNINLFLTVYLPTIFIWIRGSIFETGSHIYNNKFSTPRIFSIVHNVNKNISYKGYIYNPIMIDNWLINFPIGNLLWV